MMSQKDEIAVEPVAVKITWKAIISTIVSIVTLVGLIVGYAFAADEKYVDIAELSALHYKLEERRIEDRIQDYQDKRDYIMDKKVDGTATPTDEKRLHRYNGAIKSLERELDRLQ